MALLEFTKASGTVVRPRDPKAITFGIQDLDSSEAGRNQLGELMRDRQAVKRKLTCSWSALTDTQLNELLNAVTDQFFQLAFYDPMQRKRVTMTAYVGDRTMPLYSCIDGVYVWQSLTMNFIER